MKPSNLIIFAIIGVIVGYLLGWTVFSTPTGTTAQEYATSTFGTTTPNTIELTESSLKLIVEMRRLWADQVMWTRSSIVAIHNDLADRDQVATRLLKNSDDIGELIAPFYGSENTTNFNSLFKNHLATTLELAVAAKAGDEAKMNEVEKRLNQNVDELISEISTANRSLNKEELKTMLYDYNRLIKEDVTAHFSNSYETEISTFDRLHDQAMIIADVFSTGILKQSPEKF